MRQLPTSGKLVAGLCFSGVAFATATLFEPILDEVQRSQWFTAVCAVLGFYVGWRVMGRQVGRNYSAAARAGLGTSVWLLFWALLAFSLYEMVLRSMDRRYPNPSEALGNVPQIAYSYFLMTLTVEVMGALILGGLIAGVIAEFAQRVWR